MSISRSLAFAGRNKKELLRDPLSYIFCLGFPIVMLLIMTVINKSIPAQANMTVFQIQSLSSGIAVFALAFVMLFTCLLISKDRSSAFLLRLYASPMKAIDFIIGYMLPVIVVSVVQILITYAASMIIGIIQGYTFQILNILLATLVLVPGSIMFIAIGVFFGSMFNDKSAPGMTSIIISVSAILGGAWMDIEAMGGTLKKICDILPFYNMTKVARAAIQGNFGDIMHPLLIVMGYAIAIMILAVWIFHSKMQKDLR